MNWQQLQPKANRLFDLGLLEAFICEADPRPAKEQISDHYAHGGGWRAMGGWKFDPVTFKLRYPLDPAMPALFVKHLRDEKIFVYQSGWTAIVQADGTFEVCRLD